jgi:hypothetical protein
MTEMIDSAYEFSLREAAYSKRGSFTAQENCVRKTSLCAVALHVD